MTTKISEFRLNVVPLPAPRPRVSKFGTYMPASYKVYQKAIAAALPTKPQTPLTDELIVAIEFVCKPIAKSKFSTPMGDLDNFAKGVMDTLTDEGWWEDDRQIMSLLLTKRFPAPGEDPHINVAIQPTESP